MTRLLVLKDAHRFYSYLDEENFFAWMKKIPVIDAVRGRAGGLELTIREPVDRASLADLAALLTRYQVDMKGLRDLCQPEDEKWFKDKRKFWHHAVFS